MSKRIQKYFLIVALTFVVAFSSACSGTGQETYDVDGVTYFVGVAQHDFAQAENVILDCKMFRNCK